jgi:hypothetical protein
MAGDAMTHEPQKLDTRRIAIAGSILFAGLVVVLVVCFFLWRTWTPKTPQFAHRPPEPRLQTDAAHDLERFRRHQRNGDYWGWEDRSAGVARIPVERAMQLMAREKRPVETPR